MPTRQEEKLAIFKILEKNKWIPKGENYKSMTTKQMLAIKAEKEKEILEDAKNADAGASPEPKAPEEPEEPKAPEEPEEPKAPEEPEEPKAPEEPKPPLEPEAPPKPEEPEEPEPPSEEEMKAHMIEAGKEEPPEAAEEPDRETIPDQISVLQKEIAVFHDPEQHKDISSEERAAEIEQRVNEITALNKELCERDGHIWAAGEGQENGQCIRCHVSLSDFHSPPTEVSEAQGPEPTAPAPAATSNDGCETCPDITCRSVQLSMGAPVSNCAKRVQFEAQLKAKKEAEQVETKAEE